ncbi:DUF3987 domain-containing protein [Stackebrandtia soli]|uniref:DUF3987 domain-containing protein n=1 Tax=Stackebrandtia soli TaxID=1892856 RepID=UPI0039ECBA33
MARKKKPETDPVYAAEQAVLGAVMLAPDALTTVRAVGVADDTWSEPRHAIVWQAITATADSGAPVDPITVVHRLHDTGELRQAGGAPYVHDLIAACPTPASAEHYATIVSDAATRRRAETAAVRIAEAARRPDADLAAIVDASRADLDARSGSGGWPDPIPLTAASVDLPAFPTAALPEWVADMVEGVAVATQTPTDLAGSLALATLATATMGRVVVEPKPGWREQATLYTCVALGPGNRKSAVFDAIAAPIHAAEKALTEETHQQIIEARVEKAIAVRAAEQALAAAGKDAGDPDAVNAAKRAAIEAEELVVPAEPRLVTTDATPEATKTLLAQQDGRLAVLDDEGGIFTQIAGRYSGTPDLDAYLKGHAGGQLRVDRKSSAPEFVERAALSIGLAVQPDVIRDVARVPGFESRGLLARFLWSLPTSLVGRRLTSPPPVAPEVRDRYTRRVRDLAIAMWHTKSDAVLELTPRALSAVAALEDYREPRLGADGEWAPILSWANKWTGAILRIAGLLHIARNLDTGWRGTPIDEDTIDAASIIGHYYADHALATWTHMATGASGHATKVLAWLQRHGQAEVTRRDIHRSMCRQLTIDELTNALRILDAHGHIRIEHPPAGRGRRPAPRIHLHPSHIGGAR